uniref:Sulfatase domain-containing protein n=1 Tax=Strongyloides venezuelensis TaxID=75913 RepID=A0A0K0F142_STRVS
MYNIFFKNVIRINNFYDLDNFGKNIRKDIHENNYCLFEKFNIWSDLVHNYIKPQKKFEKCKKVLNNKYYKIDDGIITVLNNNLYCFYSCIYPNGNFRFYVTRYIYIDKSLKLNCDIIHLRCYNTSSAVIFDDVLFHINKLDKIPKESTHFLKENFSIPVNNMRYDVHIYVIDSLSYYHALRALPKTRNFLKEKYNGIEMEYLNVIGDNSRPNAYGFLLNKQNMDVDDFFSSEKTKKNDFGDLDSCKVALDNQTFIQEYYRKLGYVTLSAEDFEFGGIFTFPRCVGFKEEPAHHTLKPLQYFSLHPISSKFVKDVYKRNCYHHGFHIMDYMNDFLQKYENNLKMTIIWHTKILHDEINPIFAADKIFYNFFKKNEKHYKNSFNILMGDHGYRLSSFSISDIGRYEHKNPYFIITIPEELRSNNQLIKNLRENSKKHISHFDVYATLLDILTNAPKDGFKMLDEQKEFPIKNDTVKGLSLLRPLPNYSRSCYEMFIPPQYCLCKPKFELLPYTMVKERTKIEKNFIKTLNNKLVLGNLTDKCAEMKLDRSEKFIIKYARGGNSKVVYQVDAVTIPGKARYQAMMNKNFEVLNNEIIRLDVYREQAEPCENFSPYRIYCYCKILLHKI